MLAISCKCLTALTGFLVTLQLKKIGDGVQSVPNAMFDIEWHTTLAEYMMTQRTPFVKKQVRKVSRHHLSPLSLSLSCNISLNISPSLSLSLSLSPPPSLNLYLSLCLSHNISLNISPNISQSMVQALFPSILFHIHNSFSLILLSYISIRGFHLNVTWLLIPYTQNLAFHSGTIE